MNFKFFKGDETGTINFRPYPTFTPENVEFCFQFGDEEPIVFATGPNECNICLSPTSDTNISFNNNNRVFKLFAREIQS
jgi:hypothetical protein